ncbi:MAG: NAD(P)-binding domain-containing protein [Proteobacteria bacterium]|nr:NAD(P)-binding domain-containing protein [Pseudomonadota bacterium]
MDLETTIVGAGPYGLSIAAHLKAKRQSYRIFGSPMESWRKYMPEGMILKSEPFASNLWDPDRRFTLERYCRAHSLPYQAVGSPVRLDLFLKYAEWFRQSTGQNPIDKRVVALRRSSGSFVLHFADGEQLTSRRVVLATGHLPYQVMPMELAKLAEPLVAHCARMRELGYYSGRNVTIIGAGQSALETAALLHEAGARVNVLVRESRVYWNGPSMPRPLHKRIIAPDAGVAAGWKSFAISELPRTFRWLFEPTKRHGFVADAYGASGSWWLRDRVDGRIEISLGTHVEAASVEDSQVRLRIAAPEGTREMTTDHLIAATGYRVDIDRLSYLDPSLVSDIRREAKGIPALSSSFETSVPGLFIVGITSSPIFGPIMRFMYGAKHAAPILARRLQ